MGNKVLQVGAHQRVQADGVASKGVPAHAGVDALLDGGLWQHGQSERATEQGLGAVQVIPAPLVATHHLVHGGAVEIPRHPSTQASCLLALGDGTADGVHVQHGSVDAVGEVGEHDLIERALELARILKVLIRHCHRVDFFVGVEEIADICGKVSTL